MGISLLSSWLIVFRETFEAMILVSILISYLKKMQHYELVKPAILGGLFAIISSIATGIFLHVFYIVIAGELVEAIASFIAVSIITSVIYWMAVKGRRIKLDIESKVAIALKKGRYAIVLTTFIYICI